MKYDVHVIFTFGGVGMGTKQMIVILWRVSCPRVSLSQRSLFQPLLLRSLIGIKSSGQRIRGSSLVGLLDFVQGSCNAAVPPARALR